MASRRHRTDVLVVGSGPVGLALGAELARHGVDVVHTVLDDPHTGTPAGAGREDGGPAHPRLDSFAADDDGVRARITDPRHGDLVEVTAAYLVACDGVALPDGDLRHRPGRLFQCGPAHPAPGGGADDLAVGLGDALNLSWKLAAALHGWAGDGLLDSFAQERRPVAGAHPEAHVHPRYRSAVVADDDTSDPSDEARPGSRAPQVPLGPGRSTRDLVGPGFTLLCLSDPWSPRTDVPHPPGVPALRAAFAAAGVPLTVHECRDAEAARRYRRPLVLLRPDGYVAWRGWRRPRDPAHLVDVVRGAANRPAPSPVAVGV